MIGQLLRIKAFREKKAETEMLKSRLLLARAKAAEAEAARALDEYAQNALREERRMYEQLCSQVVRLRQITEVQQEVACLKQGELAREEALLAAERAHRDALDEFNLSLDGYRKASAARQKFDELLQQETVREGQVQEKKEESELEELAGQLRDRDDHEEYEHA